MRIWLRPFALALLLLGGCPPIGGTDGGSSSDAGTPGRDAMPSVDGGTLPIGERAAIGERVATESGDVVGELGAELVTFRGIPYAAPPVGALRWGAPEPAPPFAGGELRADAFGPECPQGAGSDRSGDEDCLTLNVWAPRTVNTRPVMVFIHGGSFITGTGSGELFDGTNLALAGDVVVVTINYRLGALGFLNVEALAAESGDGSVGNYGIRDQVAALEWVQRNIEGFGGDPMRVTIFGESAGAISICALLGSPLADGLYAGAILESGGGCADFRGPHEATPVIPSAMQRGQHFLDGLGCGGASDPLACARSASTASVLDAPPYELPVELSSDLYAGFAWGPTVDGVLLPEDTIERVARGADPDVPVIIGINRDEASLFTIGQPIHAFNYRARLAEIVGDARADDVMALYPISEYGSARNAFNAAATDLMVGCSTERFAALRTETGRPTHVYEFTRSLSGFLGIFGSVHALELLYVFGNYLGYVPTAEDLALSANMQRAWTTFAHRGVPALEPAWPRRVRGSASVAILDEPAAMSSLWRGGKCDSLRALGLTQ